MRDIHQYRYEYVQAEGPVFRYDNSAHHPKLANFPPHKHVGRKTISAIEPTLEQVLAEVVKFMMARPMSAPTTIKQRRAIDFEKIFFHEVTRRRGKVKAVSRFFTSCSFVDEIFFFLKAIEPRVSVSRAKR